MRRDVLFVLTSAFLWGTTFPAVRYGLEAGGLSPFGFLYYRFVVATLALLGIAIYFRRLQMGLFRDWRLWLFAAVNTLGYVLQFLGQERTTASKTSLLVNVNVLVTALLAYWVLRERFSRGVLWGLGFGFLGVFLLTTNGDLDALRFSNEEFVGDVMAFGTGVCWTAIILGVKAYLNARPETDTIAMNSVIFTATTIFVFGLAWATEGLAYQGNLAGAGTILYLGLFATTLAFVLWQEGLRTISAAVSAILLLFETIVALVASILFLDEGFTGWTGAGALLVLFALYLASRGPAVAPEPMPVGDRGPPSAEPRPPVNP